MAIRPSVANPENVILGDGIIYKNYGLATEREIGACRGDSKFTVTRKFKHIDYNGQYGQTKGNLRKVNVEPVLMLNLVELSEQNMIDCFAGLRQSDEGDYKEITEDLDIVTTDYWTNVAFVGATASGRSVIIIVDNPLGDIDKLEFVYKTDDEVISDVQLTGTYDRNNPTVVPYKIRYYEV